MSQTSSRLVLASGSPRRAELLRSLELEFEIHPVDIDESTRPGEDAETYVRRLAAEKADASPADADALILAADTVVVLDGDILGKPGDVDDARRMLLRLSGREHTVLTGVALRDTDRCVVEVAETEVRFRRLSSDEIEWYINCHEPYDKAGSYAMQGLGALFVDRIEGSASNVIGLPVALVYDLFSRLGYDIKELCGGPVREPAG